MAAKKYLKNTAGAATEESAIDTSAGAGDSGKIVAVNASGVIAHSILNAVGSSAGAADADKLPYLDAAGLLDMSFMPVGVGADTYVITASEALTAGNLVNIHISTGVKVRKADATTAGMHAHGFVLANVSNGASATVYFRGSNTAVSGLTAGTEYVLSDTAGGLLAVASAPTGTGKINQRVGIAVAATVINHAFQIPIVLA